MSSAQTSVRSTPTITEFFFRIRWILGGLSLLVVCSLILGALASPTDYSFWSIHNPQPEGARALGEVLKSKGVKLKDVYNIRDAYRLKKNDALVVVSINRLDDKALRDLMHLETNVFFLGAYAREGIFEPYVHPDYSGSSTSIPARCDFAPARAAGSISGSLGSLRPLRSPDQACFPIDDESFVYLQFQKQNGMTLGFLADVEPVANGSIIQSGNAAFLLNLLSPAEHVGWLNGDYFQETSVMSNDETTFPPRFINSLVVFFAALLVFALATGRRLGAVVPEELPVAVHGAEVIYGRARMYRKSGALDAASTAARKYTARRLAQILHIPAPLASEEMTTRLEQDLQLPASQIRATLFGSTPGNATELINLLSQLKKLVDHTHRKEKHR